jgi:hypothetical protein
VLSAQVVYKVGRTLFESRTYTNVCTLLGLLLHVPIGDVLLAAGGVQGWAHHV